MAKKMTPSRILSALRKLWLQSPERYEATVKAKIKLGSRVLGYRCKKCNIITKQFDVDHIIPVGSYKAGWDQVIKNLFCPVEGLQILCKRCHGEKK